MISERAGSLRLFAVAIATLSACMLTDAAWYDVPGINGRQITLYGKPFFARGVCYSPVPINESMLFGPYGDYFTDQYAFLWRRDLPLIRAMGANSIRVYGWDDSADHSLFLNYVVEQGLRVLITFPLGSASNTPVRGDENRKKVVDRFATQVGKYGEHPAILAWSFGNEINMMEHGFLQEFDREFVCGWNVHEEAKGGCYNPAHPPNASNPCYDSSYCVYDKLFRWIEQAAFAAHQKALTPILSTFSDTDLVLDKIQRVGHVCPSVNIWAVQLYRGFSFGPWFEQAQNASNSPTNFKPFLVTEYGVDAYHDVCGNDPLKTPCFNQLGDSSGSHEDEGTQALYNRNLTIELGWHSSAQPQCNPNSAIAQELRSLTGDDAYLNQTCVSAGGFVYSWVDEYWKGSYVAAECRPNFWEPAFTLDTCEYKAHVTCPNWNASLQDLCGQPLYSSPDHYQNEEWFGLTSPIKCADSMDRCARAPQRASATRRAAFRRVPVRARPAPASRAHAVGATPIPRPRLAPAVCLVASAPLRAAYACARRTGRCERSGRTACAATRSRRRPAGASPAVRAAAPAAASARRTTACAGRPTPSPTRARPAACATRAGRGSSATSSTRAHSSRSSLDSASSRSSARCSSPTVRAHAAWLSQRPSRAHLTPQLALPLLRARRPASELFAQVQPDAAVWHNRQRDRAGPPARPQAARGGRRRAVRLGGQVRQVSERAWARHAGILRLRGGLLAPLPAHCHEIVGVTTCG
jgi:hypothetical protein